VLLPLRLLDSTSPPGANGNLNWTSQNSIIAIAELSSDSLVANWTSQNSRTALTVNLTNPVSLAWTSQDSTVAITGSLLDATALSWTSQNNVVAINSSLTDNVSLAWTSQSDTVTITGNVAFTGVTVTAVWTDSNSVINGSIALLNSATIGIQSQSDTMLINAAIPVDSSVNWQGQDSQLVINGQVTGQVVVPLLPLGGDDHKGINWQAKQVNQKTQTVTDLVDNAVAGYYQELTSSNAPKKLRHKAAKIVKPYALDDRKVTIEVDFESLRNDINRVKLLFSLYLDYINQQKTESLLTNVIIQAVKRKATLNKMAVVYSYLYL
jgi:hypothetical protein